LDSPPWQWWQSARLAMFADLADDLDARFRGHDDWGDPYTVVIPA